jgi:tight adherence protein B
MTLLFALGWFVFGFTVIAERPARALAALQARYAAARRRIALGRQVPDAFESMAAALRAGRSVPQAVAWFAAEGPEPLAGEFAVLVRAMHLGATFEEALAETARRTAAPGLDTAAYTLGPLRASGANLAAALEGMAGVLRRREAATAKLATLTAQAKLQLVFLAAVFPGLVGILFVMEPEMMLRLVREPSGRVFLLAGFGLQAVSFAGARRILNPQTLWK